MNDGGGSETRSPRAGRNNSFLPNSFRAILRGASTLASTVRTAGSSVAATISTAAEDRERELVQWAGFDRLELESSSSRRVLLLAYLDGFRVWDVDNADDVWEIVSKRDGPISFLRVQPRPLPDKSDCALKAAHPLLLVVTTDATNRSNTGIPNGISNGYGVVGSPHSGESTSIPRIVKFYSLQNHQYVHTLRFRSAIYAVRCSYRVVVIALASQLYCLDAATLQNTFSVLTYPSPHPGPQSTSFGYGAVAVGPRWLAYAANQPLISNTGRVSPQHLTPSPGVSPSTSPANGSLVAHYAKESSKQIASGIVTLGDMGYKAISRYCTDATGSPEVASPLQKGNSHVHPDHAGTVIIRDFVKNTVVSQFRAHESPLSALCFDPTGTLLVTASIYGHNINIFQIMPNSNMNGTTSGSHDVNASHVHLYKLSRGVTNAVIQDIAFSEDSHWIVVSSSRGTNHLFAISPFGGTVGSTTSGSITTKRSFPWWSNMGAVKSSQCLSSSPPPTVSLSVVSRIKNGNGGWRGTVSGAAAAASGRPSTYLGAVAAVFHDGHGQKLYFETGQATLREQLWVLTPSGHLIRYALHMSAGSDIYKDNGSPAVTPGGPKEVEDIRMVVEPLQKWDVCRRPNWLEREGKLQSPSSQVVGSKETLHSTMHCNGDVIHNQLFLSKAEVQMHHYRPPLWVKTHISFHVFTGNAQDGILENDDVGGEIEIEKVSTRMVEVRKKDLVPVLDRLRSYEIDMDRNYEIDMDRRDRNVLLGGALHYPTIDSDVCYGVIHTDAGINGNHSSSGSSCGSDGSLYNGVNEVKNGINLYRDPALTERIQPMPFTLVDQSKHNQNYGQKSQLPNLDPNNNSQPISNSVGYPPVDISYNHNYNFPTPVENSEAANRGQAVIVIKEGCTEDKNDIPLPNGYFINQPDVNMDADNINTAARQPGCQVVEASSSGTLSDVGKSDCDGIPDDNESTDGNSKSDLTEQGDDGWEGAMFPFAED